MASLVRLRWMRRLYVGLLCWLAAAGVAQAAIFTVNSPADVGDINPGDGVCHTGAMVPTCTLRAAIEETNALTGADEIILPSLPSPGVYLLTLAAQLTIGSNLTITGGGASTTIIDGNKAVRPSSRVVTISSGFTVTITGVTIQNGQGSSDVGGIRNSGTLTLINSTVSGNSAPEDGGGIFNTGTVTLINSTVSDNSAGGWGGGIYGNGTVTLANSTLRDNEASLGGGIYNDGGTATLTNSTVSDNGANNDGGGIYNDGGTVTLVNSTISGNGTFGNGGGIYVGNSIFLPPAVVNSFNSTIVDNAVYGSGGGVYVKSGGSFNFQNTILAGNFIAFVATPSDCAGNINSNGNNLMFTVDGCTVNGSGVTLADPQLGSLQNNGGATRTHALLLGSPAINAGSPLGCRDQFGAPLTTDQRGFPRPSNGTACDIGAYEFFAIACPSQSLQAAIDAANPGDVIPVSGTCNENILIRNEKQRITVDGLGTATINGPNAASPVLNVRGKGILIQGFTITGGSHGIHVNRGSNAVIDSNSIHNTGANGIYVDELAFAVVVNNLIDNNPGAGIFVSEKSTARIGFNSDSEIMLTGNGIYDNAAGVVVSNGSSARIVNNEILGNAGPGIHVLRDSQADVASNDIIANGGDGIAVEENSVVQLGEDSGTATLESPNSGTNAGFGIRCTRGGVADGRRGSLTGNSGATSFDASCINSLLP